VTIYFRIDVLESRKRDPDTELEHLKRLDNEIESPNLPDRHPDPETPFKDLESVLDHVEL